MALLPRAKRWITKYPTDNWTSKAILLSHVWSSPWEDTSQSLEGHSPGMTIKDAALNLAGFYVSPCSCQIHRNRKTDRVLGAGESMLDRNRISTLKKNGKFWKWMMVTVVQQCEWDLYHWSVHLDMGTVGSCFPGPPLFFPNIMFCNVVKYRVRNTPCHHIKCTICGTEYIHTAV